MSIFDKIGHQLDPHRIIDEVHHGIDDALHQLEDAGHHITDEAKQHLQGEVANLINQAKSEFEKDLKSIEEAFKHIGDLKSAFTAESIKAGINTTLSFIQRYPVLPRESELGLSVVTVFFDDITDTKIAGLQKHLNDPPSDRAGITDLILTLAPTKLHIGGDFSLFSDALGARGGVTFYATQIATIVNHICDDLGY